MGPRRIELLPQPCEGRVLAVRLWAPNAIEKVFNI